MIKRLLILALLEIIIGGFCGLTYLAMQQNLRQSANDPQIQIAEDTAVALSNGQVVQSVVPLSKVDMASSLATFVIIYDSSGNSIASSVQLDGKTPILPQGVFTYVGSHGEDRITWQPKTGVREAAVIAKYDKGFVLAGRSLRETERREDQAALQVLAAWVAFTVVSAAIFVILPK